MGSANSMNKPSEQQQAVAANEASSASVNSDSWVTSVSKDKRSTGDSAESKIKAALSYRMLDNKPALYLPSDMAELQPRTLAYLQNFAKENDLTLVEDRRKLDVKPIVEKRDTYEPKMVLGMSMLLKQAGMPGAARSLSEPHRLHPESPYFSLSKLIDMAAFSAPNSKRVKLDPNRITVKALNNNTHPITAYGCNLKYGDITTVLSHFESPSFRAIGYSAGNQYVLHLCLGGGSKEDPNFWVNSELLQSMDFKFQLYEGQDQSDDFGLFYATLYIDLAQAPYPWWLQNLGSDSKATNDALNTQGNEVA